MDDHDIVRCDGKKDDSMSAYSPFPIYPHGGSMTDNLSENLPYNNLSDVDFRAVASQSTLPQCAEFLSTRVNYNHYLNRDHFPRICDQIDPDINLLIEYQRNTQYSTAIEMSHNIGKNQNKLSFLCINTRSVLPKVDDLLLLLSQIPVKIIALSSL